MRTKTRKAGTAANLGFEARLWAAADAQKEDGEPFAEKMRRLTTQLREQQAAGARLDKGIVKNLKQLGFE